MNATKYEEYYKIYLVKKKIAGSINVKFTYCINTTKATCVHRVHYTILIHSVYVLQANQKQIIIK